MNKRALIWAVVAAGTQLASDGNAQDSLNVALVGRLDPLPIRYSGCWGWTSIQGEEYALLGTYNGTSIIAVDDPASIAEVAFVPGPASNWREITAVGEHAYVVSEGSGDGAGMQVIDLGGLPEQATLVTTYTATFTTAHIIQRDVDTEDPYVYVMGTSSTGGVHIIDVSAPGTPAELGVYAPYYIHDAHVRDGRVYAAAIWEGVLDIVDISDKSDPTLLKQVSYPSALTHSSFTTQDRTHIFVTDELDGLPARMWNIEDLNNIVPVAEYTSNSASLVHNPYTRDDLIFVSHNTEGLRVLDVGDPALIVEVGWYDTYAGPSGGFHGLWSAYPWFPSGKIIGGNREDGLWVFEFNGIRAGRIYGIVTDAVTSAPIPAASAVLVETGTTCLTGADGAYELGDLPSPPAGYTLTVTAAGYLPHTMAELVLAAGDRLTMDVALLPVGTGLQDPQVAPLPAALELDQNAPNPFNPATTIRYRLAEAGPVTLAIYTTGGSRLATLVAARQHPGEHTVTWGGLDDHGNRAPSGIYFYELRAGGWTETRKMVLAK